MTTNAERLALALHILGLTDELDGASEQRDSAFDHLDDFTRTDTIVSILYGLDEACARMDTVGWPLGFDVARDVAKDLRTTCAPARRLRNLLIHLEDRVVNFRHPDRGTSTSRRRVRGETIPVFISGIAYSAEGVHHVEMLGRRYELHQALAESRRLRSALIHELFDEHGETREDPLPGQ